MWKNISLSEIPVIKQIRYWSKLNNYINKFKVVDIESEKDELLNDKTIGFLDKVQFDLMALAKKENLPFVCDDLIIRKLCNSYKVNHTNSMQLVKKFSKNYDEYISNFIKYAKSNYIYTLYTDVLSELSKNLYENFDEDNKNKFLSVIESVLENKESLEYYLPILLSRIENLKGVQFIKIFDEVYENSFASFFINDIYKLIEVKCKENEIDLKKYYK